jgi:hypothetical protein
MKTIFLKFIKIILLSIIFIACEDKIVTDPDPKPSVTQTTFTEIQNKVFNVSCTSSGCHGGSNIQGGLNLTAGVSYSQLVNVNSLENPSLKRVQPGSSAQSFLIRKLEGTGTSIMPPSGKLSQSTIDSIKAWIDRGALNN